MTDLAVLVPSRGRPGNVARLVEACAKTCRTDVLLMFGFDDDDPELGAYKAAMDQRSVPVIEPRMGLVAWTNYLCGAVIDGSVDVPYLASLGDDHLPITDGWDELLIAAVQKMGGGFAYPDDERRVDIPEAVVVDTRIIRALGWMALPDLRHWYVDNVWADLGRGAGRLAFCRDVIVRHLRPDTAPGVPADATYTDAAKDWDPDLRAYQKWRLYQMPRDVETVRAACSR